MEKKHILSGVLTAACTAVILGLVLVQTRVALRPNLQISFSPPPIAYGYAFRNVFISGVVYNDDGKTPVGANRVVAVTFNGGSIRGTGATTSTGHYLIYPLSHSGAGVRRYGLRPQCDGRRGNGDNAQRRQSPEL